MASRRATPSAREFVMCGDSSRMVSVEGRRRSYEDGTIADVSRRAAGASGAWCPIDIRSFAGAPRCVCDVRRLAGTSLQQSPVRKKMGESSTTSSRHNRLCYLYRFNAITLTEGTADW